jgi:hypothetical protein
MPYMSSAASANAYIAPTFDLYEFDDGSPSPAPSARRRLINWQALVGKTTFEVVLAWSPGAGVVVTVGTSDRSHERKWLRFDCAVQALGGDLPVPARPEPAAAVHQEIDRIAAADDLWRPLPPMFPGAPEGEAAELEGYAIGYCHLDKGTAVTVAAIGIPVARFRVRNVQDWGPYDIDASKSHTLEELDRARREHGNTE